MKSFLVFLSLALFGGIVFFEDPIDKNAVIDYIEVHKSERCMYVYQKGKLLKEYRIALGFTPEGKKEFKGDGKTPEGTYYINGKNPHSVAYKNLGISYPNSEDLQNARAKKRSAGGDIKIHGLIRKWRKFGTLHSYVDWTAGCIAVTNSEMEELYRHVKIGAKIKIIE
jgi:murein L,D-transpeptidase YafK